MSIVKALHVICVFIWVGNLLTLTRLMGYHVKEDENTQRQMAKIYKRMYNFIGLPTMTLSILFGMILITALDHTQKLAWFYWKLVFVAGLIVCDITCGKWVTILNFETETGRGLKYKILHGVTGLMFIGVIVSIYVIRHKNG